MRSEDTPKPLHTQIGEAATTVGDLIKQIASKEQEVRDLERPYRTADNQLSNLKIQYSKAVMLVAELSAKLR